MIGGLVFVVYVREIWLLFIIMLFSLLVVSFVEDGVFMNEREYVKGYNNKW